MKVNDCQPHRINKTEEINLITRGGIGWVNVQCWIIKPAHYAPNQSVCTLIAPFLCITFSNTEWSNHFTINISVVGPLQRHKKACCQMSRFPVPPLVNCLLTVTAKQANGISRWFRPQVEGWHSKLWGGGQMGSTMTRSKSTEIKNNNTISLRIRALKSHLIIPKNWPDTKRWDSRGGALTLNRGGAKEIIRLNFNVSKLKTGNHRNL